MQKKSAFCLVLLGTFLAFPSFGQIAPLNQRDVDILFDSGEINPARSVRGVIYSDIIEVENASWLRLRYDLAQLGESEMGPTLLRITSLQDGLSQTMNTEHLRQWQNSSAYFNGNGVMIEVIASPDASPSRVRVNRVHAGNPEQTNDRSICGPTDDRTLSSDPRQGRVEPIGCTGWMITDEKRCFLTAGHCDGGAEVMEFNVPLSTAGGAAQHPGPDDQYAIDPMSMQTNGGQGVGNDWAYFGCFPNTNTGLTPFQAQGDAYVLADPPTVTTGQTIRITGYGSTDGTLASLTWSGVQKTHTGPLVFVTPSTVNYQTDTTGGNSGSPIIHEDTGNAIGIHTHAGCSASNGNNGTNILFGPLQAALNTPWGICKPDPLLAFAFPQGLPELFIPDGQTIRVEVSGANGGIPQAGTGMLHYDLNDGSGMQTVAMNEVSANIYDAVLPTINCGTRVSYFFSAQTSTGVSNQAPDLRPNRTFIAEVATRLDASFNDSFETDQGWTVENGAGLSDGAWERGTPGGGGNRQDPRFDVDGSGQCFITDNVAGNSDVDGGATTLVSPIMDASQGDPHIEYWRWFFNSDDNTGDDVMVVEISDDGGNNWSNLESIGPTGAGTAGGWLRQSFRVADFVTLTDQFRIRFTVSDTGTGSIVEAGIDAVRLSLAASALECDVPCMGNFNGDQIIDEADFLIMIDFWETDNPFDLNSDSASNMLDLVQVLDLFGACP